MSCKEDRCDDGIWLGLRLKFGGYKMLDVIPKNFDGGFAVIIGP